MRASGNSPRMAMIASIPPISGICRSIKVTSGRFSLNCASASRPVAASPAISMSASASIKAPIPSRSSGWSSAMRIRIGFSAPLTFAFFPAWFHSGEAG